MTGTTTLTFSITGPTEQALPNLLAFARLHGLTETVPGAGGGQVPNPVTPQQAFQEALRRYVEGCVAAWSVREAEAQARAQASAAVALVAASATTAMEITENTDAGG